MLRNIIENTKANPTNNGVGFFFILLHRLSFLASMKQLQQQHITVEYHQTNPNRAEQSIVCRGNTTLQELARYLKNTKESCKYFSQANLLHNYFIINALQNLLFCNPKAQVLHGKRGCFASQNLRFRNAKSKLPFFIGIFFTKRRWFSSSALEVLESSRKTMFLFKVQCFFGAKSMIYHAPALFCCSFCVQNKPSKQKYGTAH